MSKKNNVNPDHYKTAGGRRQSEPGLQERQKQEYTTAQVEQPSTSENFIPGAPSLADGQDEQVKDEAEFSEDKPRSVRSRDKGGHD